MRPPLNAEGVEGLRPGSNRALSRVWPMANSRNSTRSSDPPDETYENIVDACCDAPLCHAW